jgi:hypothetical protein
LNVGGCLNDYNKLVSSSSKRGTEPHRAFAQLVHRARHPARRRRQRRCQRRRRGRGRLPPGTRVPPEKQVPAPGRDVGHGGGRHRVCSRDSVRACRSYNTPYWRVTTFFERGSRAAPAAAATARPCPPRGLPRVPVRSATRPALPRLLGQPTPHHHQHQQY